MREGRVKGGVRWRDGLLEELEGRDMIGDIVFNVFFIILGSLEEASLGVFAFVVLWLAEKGVEHSPNLRCSIPRLLLNNLPVRNRLPFLSR